MTPVKSAQEQAPPPAAPAAVPGDRRRWPVWLIGWVLFTLILLIFCGLKAFTFRPLFGDEHIYYYMAKIMIEGKALPYRDFFFAHPPFQLLLAAAVFKVFGATFTVAKCLSIGATIASGVGIFVIGWRRLGLFEALAATAAFLFSYNVLRVSSHYTGGNLALALIVCGVCLLMLRRDVLAAILLALSAHTAVYSIPPIALVLGLHFLYEPKRALKVTAFVAGIYIAITIVFIAIAGHSYIEGVFSYHFMKKPRASDKMKYLSLNFLFHNFYLTWSIVVAAFCLIWGRREPSAKPVAAPPRHTEARPKSKHHQRNKLKRDRRHETPPASPWKTVWAYWITFSRTRSGFVALLLLFLLANFTWEYKLTEWYDYYFLILYPAMALLVGYVVAEIFIGAIVAFRHRRWLMVARSFSICVLIAVGCTAVKRTQAEQFYPGRSPDKLPKPQEYVWQDAPGLGPINAWYRALFWSDQRDWRREYTSLTYYLWHEMRHLEHLDTAVAYLREHSRPEDRLFGESGTAPLLAFMADRDLVAYMADTNTKRVSSGQISVQQMREVIDVPELRYVIATRAGNGPYRYINRYFDKWLNSDFTPVHQFTSPTNRGITWFILERKTPRDTPS